MKEQTKVRNFYSTTTQKTYKAGPLTGGISNGTRRRMRCYYEGFCNKFAGECGGRRVGECRRVNSGEILIPSNVNEFNQVKTHARNNRRANNRRKRRRTSINDKNISPQLGPRHPTNNYNILSPRRINNNYNILSPRCTNNNYNIMSPRGTNNNSIASPLRISVLFPSQSEGVPTLLYLIFMIIYSQTFFIIISLSNLVFLCHSFYFARTWHPSSIRYYLMLYLS